MSATSILAGSRPPRYSVRLFVAAAIPITMLMIVGGFTPAEAQSYANIVMDVTESKVTPYTGFDLVQMKLTIENLDSAAMSDAGNDYVTFVLGGSNGAYWDVSYSDVRGKGGNVSVEDCTAADRWTTIGPGSTGEANLCFMVGKEFEADALLVYFYDCTRTWSDGDCRSSKSRQQVIPSHSESAFCFVENSGYCNADNVQPLIGQSAPSPAPEPEPDPEPTAPPTHATLLHTIYQNHTGTLVMVFDRPVIANNPDRIQLIHDIDEFIEDGAAPDLGDSDLYTVDNKRQSAVLVFALDSGLRLAVTESLRSYTDLALLIDTLAVYSAEDFTDVTEKDGSPILVPDIDVVR